MSLDDVAAAEGFGAVPTEVVTSRQPVAMALRKGLLSVVPPALLSLLCSSDMMAFTHSAFHPHELVPSLSAVALRSMQRANLLPEATVERTTSATRVWLDALTAMEPATQSAVLAVCGATVEGSGELGAVIVQWCEQDQEACGGGARTSLLEAVLRIPQVDVLRRIVSLPVPLHGQQLEARARPSVAAGLCFLVAAIQLASQAQDGLAPFGTHTGHAAGCVCDVPASVHDGVVLVRWGDASIGGSGSRV